MSNNDLIRRSDALDAVRSAKSGIVLVFGGSRPEDWSVSGPAAVSNINAIPAAPQPMSADCFSRLGKAFLARLSIPQGMSEEEAAEKIIEEWAQEHPERSDGE